MSKMQLLIQQIKIFAPAHPLHGKTADIFIQDGVYKTIGERLQVGNVPTFRGAGRIASIGWFDLGVYSGDPGFEHREDWASLSQAAISGGYTAVACWPNTRPVMHSKSEILYAKRQSQVLPIDVYPIGAISAHCNGKDITEMMDMKQAGAIAFSDGKKSIQDGGLMMRALQYVKAFDGLVINFPNDKAISATGQLHEGKVSTSLGMRGIPTMAEVLMLQRDLNLLDYTDSRLHISNISSAASVDLIRAAKAKGLKVTASVPALNLAYTVDDLLDFDANLKLMPPLREKSDQEALWQALKEGTIDAITSNHTPLEEEAKKLEFAYAEFGAIGLETTFGLLNQQAKGRLSTEELIEKLAYGARSVLNLPRPSLQKGEPANLTIIDPEENWKLEANQLHSKSKNTPLLGNILKGKVKAVVSKDEFYTFE